MFFKICQVLCLGVGTVAIKKLTAVLLSVTDDVSIFMLMCSRCKQVECLAFSFCGRVLEWHQR